MKRLSEDEMVQLVTASQLDRELLAHRMARVVDPRTAQWLAAQVQNKNLNVTTVIRRGVRIGAIWWWYSPLNKALVLNAGASFVQEDTTFSFMAAYQELARLTGAETMELQTARAGVVKIYRENGWTVAAVAMNRQV